MPVYLCQPGATASEPWRHGIQVYAAPYAMDEVNSESLPMITGNANNSSAELGAGSNEAARWSTNDTPAERDLAQAAAQSEIEGRLDMGVSGSRSSVAGVLHRTNNAGIPIRRVRHAEVVLVDDVCVAFDRYWLRLRWPGGKGGFAGYIALGKVSQEPSWLKNQVESPSRPDSTVNERQESPQEANNTRALNASSGVDDRVTGDEMDNDDPTREDEPQDNASTRSSEPFESTSTLHCLRTGMPFPSSAAMKLLHIYDDGICPPVTSAPLPSEQVFCRICREGIHDDADEDQPSPAMENEGDDTTLRGPSTSRPGSSFTGGDELEPQESDAFDEREPQDSEPPSGPLSKGPVLPHPTYHANQHAAENPMLAPCECAGSMAFVHYLCIEQWRCRSRHPEARQGLQCETCGKPYALPPPSARPANVMQTDNEDWLEAMPPHVMQALRQPHVWWQVGAAVVRRRWLRPLAPVVMSPIVALYCRARRLLKKKGVARRRWACSLCRRRARWKCVRCLRSYYCSRQCQNVSWHIVHKHVCYKPTRWAWSVVVYGLATLYFFPGILRDPLMYDLGLGFVPISFYVMAILAGGIATALKKGAGLDLRGRAFEMLVIFSTMWLIVVSWGLVGAFFGQTSRCHGVFGRSYNISKDDLSTNVVTVLRGLMLQPAKKWFLMWDRLALNSGPWFRKAMCMEQEEGCFQHLHRANTDFIYEEFDGGKCAADLSMVAWLYVSAGVAATGNQLWKRRERRRRAARRPVRGEPRPHQD